MTGAIDLKLDGGEEEHPRRFVVFPDGQIVAYGGDDGTLSCVDVTNVKEAEKVNVRILRQYDEAAVRAIAVSSDGQRVAIGFDTGAIRICEYNDYTETTTRHPFVPAAKANSVDDDEDEDYDNGFLSQPDKDDDDDDSDKKWAGPLMEGPIRDLKFLPDSHWLAVASEGGLCIVNVSSADTVNDRYLQIQSEKEHDGGGVRGVAIATEELHLMASLAMDGRLCVWKTSGLENLNSVTDMVPVLREATCCVPRKDIGECMDADPSDRSSIPHWVKPGVLALPGKTQLQLREVTLANESIIVEESKQPPNTDPSKGHIESIVALTSQGDFIASSGRDGRVILWQLQEDEDGLPAANFVQTLGQYESIPTSLYWKENTLFMACANGTLQTVACMDKKALTQRNVEEKAPLKASKPSTVEKNASPGVKSPETKLSSPKKTTSKKPSDESYFLGLGDSDDEEMALESPPKSSKDTRKKQRSKITFSDSEDEDSDKENDEESTKTPTASKPSPTQKMDDMKEDAEDDDFVGPETQPPSVRSVLETLSDSDDDDVPSNSPPSKSPAKEKSNNEQEASDVEESKAASKPKTSSEMEADDDESVREPMEDLNEKKNTKEKYDSVDDDDESDREPMEDSKEKDLDATQPSEESPKKGSIKRLVKQSKSTQDDEDEDEDDIFDDVEKDDKKQRRVSFIEEEAEDSKDLADEEDEAMDEKEPASETSALSPSNEEKTAASPSKDDGSVGLDDSGGHDDGGDFPIHDDDEDSTARDLAVFNENFYQSHEHTGAGLVLPEPQAAFAPSATPLDLARRFLCWNSVGSVTLINDEMGNRSTVDINFTDKAFRRPVSFTDNMGFILGSLGDDGAIFATDLAQDEEDLLNDEDDVMDGLSLSAQTKAALRKSQKQRMRKGSTGRQPLGSSIYFHRFETFASLRDKDWYLTLPDGERVLGCASGQGWAAAVTSRKFLRVFTSGGAQGQILWLPGNPVTVVGRGRFLAVFYHESMPLQDGTQRLGYMLYDAVASRTVSKGPVSCVTAGSSLSWATFSNDCSLMAMDSDGMLSMLIATSLPSPSEEGSTDDVSQSTSFEWSPLLDTVGLRKSSEDSFWPITVFDGKLVCIPLKGGTQYPDAARRPITATIGMKMPLARSTLAKSSALEELSVRSNIALVQKKVNNDISCGDLMGDEDFEQEYRSMCAQVDKVTLKLFATTVEAGKLERALDLVDRLHLEKSYELAMAIAESHDKLVDFIEEVKESKFPPPEEEDDDDDVEDEPEGDVDEGSTRYDDVNSSPPGNKLQSSRRISPESNNAWKSSKRAFGGQHERNVRARAF